LVSVVTAGVILQGYGVLAGILTGIGCGTLCGFINGLWIAKAQMNPFIVTLGMNFIVSGIALLYTGGDTISIPEESIEIYGWFGEGYLYGIPVPVILAAINTVIIYFFLNQTRLGMHIYATGGKEETAIVSGINVVRVKIWVYTLSGLLASVGGFILSSRCISGTPILGAGSLLLESIGAVVIGGTSLFGGEGGILRTLLGVMIMSCMVNGLNLLATSTYVQDMIVGGIIILTVWIAMRRQR
jgi:ribose transport system permease protein